MGGRRRGREKGEASGDGGNEVRKSLREKGGKKLR